jgi:hypothetical protein
MMYSTAVTRDVNPIFNCSVVLTNTAKSDPIRIAMIDYGVFQSNHVGGLGPFEVCSTTIGTESDFDGFLVLAPARQVKDQGCPVVQMSCRLPEISFNVACGSFATICQAPHV